MKSILMRTSATLTGLLMASAAWGASHGHAHTAQGVPADLPASTIVSTSNCWIRHMPPPAPSGGFLQFHNTGSQAVTLNGVSSPDYNMVMMHETTEKDGMSRMSLVEQISLPSGEYFDFKPGSHHLMLEQPREGLKVGDQVRVDFSLDDGTGVSVQCELKSPKSMPGMSDQHHH